MVRGKHALPFQIYDRLFGWVPRLASAAVAATAGERADLLAYGFPPERVHVIPVGLDVDTLPAVPPRSTLTGRLLFVGRVGPDRRVEHLIRLLAIVARAIPSASLRVVGRIDPSVGSAGKGYVTFLLDLAQGLGVAERLEFVGEITGPALWDEYTTADVYVNMSVYENFGQAFLEAAAMELPLFSTSVGVAASLIVPGETGYFLDAANLENTAMNVIRVLQHPGLWRHMGRSAAAIARRDYSLAAVARAYMNLYRDLIQHPWPAMSDPLTRPGMRQAAPPPESEALVMNQDTMRESTSSAGVHERAGV
jgi:glycosyltransferase involved in cell wall biosynthesis